jgi:CcmD family protein
MIAFDPQPASSGTPDDRATGFTAVDPTIEQFSGSTLLVEAYAAIWVVLMVWIFFLWRKQASLAERLDDLERTIDRAAASAEKKAKAGAS